MIKRLILIPLLAVAAMMLVPLQAVASDHPEEVCAPSPDKPGRSAGKADFKRWMKQMKKYKRDFLTRELNLSDEQQEAFFAIYDKMEDEKWQLGREVRRMEREINKKGNEATDLELEKAADAAVELPGKQNEVERRYHEEFKKVLTKRQLFKMSAAERKFQKSLMEQRGKKKKKD